MPVSYKTEPNLLLKNQKITILKALENKLDALRSEFITLRDRLRRIRDPKYYNKFWREEAPLKEELRTKTIQINALEQELKDLCDTSVARSGDIS